MGAPAVQWVPRDPNASTGPVPARPHPGTVNAHRVFPCFPEVPTDHRVTRIYDVQADDPIYKHAAKQSPQATRQTRQATPSPFSFLLLLCGEDIKVRGLLS